MSISKYPLVPFEFEGRRFRVITDEKGEPWFVAANVCSVLGIGNAGQAMTRLDADERGVVSTDTPGGKQTMTTVNEPGFFALVLGSRKPQARCLQRWLTYEVLPSIRRTGLYGLPGIAPTPAAVPAGMQDSVNALLLIGRALAQLPDVEPGIARAATLTCIEENTGLSMSTNAFRLHG